MKQLNAYDQPIGQSLPGWQPPPRPARAALSGRYCRLEPLHDNHATALFAAYDDKPEPRDWTYLPYGPFANREEFAGWITTQAAGDDPQFFAVLTQADDQPLGVASYLRIEPAAGSIEVGHIHFAPALQRTPAATEAMYLMMENVFRLGYRRYEWKCDALNAPSRRAAERLGFRFEGVFRQATVYKNRNRDTAWFSVIDGEWPALRAAFHAWLDDANFDPDGKQRRSLSAMRAAASA